MTVNDFEQALDVTKPQFRLLSVRLLLLLYMQQFHTYKQSTEC